MGLVLGWGALFCRDAARHVSTWTRRWASKSRITFLRLSCLYELIIITRLCKNLPFTGLFLYYS